MSCCGGQKGSAAEIKTSTSIDKGLNAAKKEQQNHIKLLLLGAGESGKSTIAKQMKIIHLNGFTDDERMTFKPVIFSNMYTSARTLCEAARNLGINVSGDVQAITDRIIKDEYFTGELNASIVQDMKLIWADAGIQETFQQSYKFQLTDSTEYYFVELDRIASPNYVPSVDDILRSRAKTTGIIETEFSVGPTKFTIVDVGGQRSERRKWMHCFQDVTAVIFCVALAEYDLKLYEDETTNRMQEALKLFKDICSSKWFQETDIILFLNKKDLFAKKIVKQPLTICFPNYPGKNTYEEASAFIQDQFLAQNDNPRKLIYPHFTCATDTQNITVVFRAVQDILLNKILKTTIL